MFYQHSNGSSTLPRGFRFHHDEEPKTPEPQDTSEPQIPSPPRQRLRVRRRNASSTFNAPTEQFLASIAAADVPIPTIEEPRAASVEEDCEMLDLPIIQTRFLTPQPFRAGSPPKTPMPQVPIDDVYPQHRPDWAAGGSPLAGDYFLGAMSSFSTPGSEFSDDSFYSGSRASRPSDDGSCTSPESEVDDPFQFPNPTEKKGKGTALFGDCLGHDTPKPNSKLHRKTRRDAPWTDAQNSHLWATYLLYLSDPTVTPFRIGHSSVPPQGIVRRVAREAKRSWKGPKLPTPISRSTRLDPSRAPSDKSGSLTPTAEFARTYGQWPHSSNLTRTRLRELCRSKDMESNPVQVHRHFQSRSPTPFSKAFRKQEAPKTFSFNTSDIALSLTTSTAESMQPDGPLAKLAAVDLDSPTLAFPPVDNFKPLVFGESLQTLDMTTAPKLGSPFLARTYGPSSSNTTNIRPASPRTRSDTGADRAPRLGSPVRFDQPRSLNGTMKRRAQHSLDEELGPNGAVVRPSILDDQLICNPFNDHRRRVRSRGFTMGDEGLLHRVPGLFNFHNQVPTVPALTSVLQNAAPTSTLAPPPQLLPAPIFPPPRLGSPFSESGSGSRNTFPRRLFQESSATIRRSAFKTMHQTRRSIESFDFGEGPSLQSRLSHLDQRLKEIKGRESSSRTHEQRD